MRAITGDETGLLKLVDVSAKTATSYGEQDRQHGIKGMVWIIQNEEFILVRVNGILEYYIVVSGGELVRQDSMQVNLTEGEVVGLVTNQEGTVAVYTSTGAVFRYSLTNKGRIEQVADPMAVRGPLSAVTFVGSRMAVGGQENDVQLWDMEKSEVTWSAKNVSNDFLSLRVPVWVTALSFMKTNDVFSEHEIVTGTGHKHVRLYDVRARRQPVLSMDIGDFRVTTLAPHIDGSSVFVGDTSGGFNLWDVRSSKRAAVLSGATGSIRHCATHPYGSTVATVSLDRFLRLYDCTKNFKSISSVYLKNRINSCIVFDDFHGGDDRNALGGSDEDASGDEDSNAEDVIEEIDGFGSDSEESSAGGVENESSRKKLKGNSGGAVKKAAAPTESESDSAGSDDDSLSMSSDESLVFGGDSDDDHMGTAKAKNGRKGVVGKGAPARGGAKRGRGGRR